MEQKDEFSRYMETAKRLASALAASTEKSRAYAWLKYLQDSAKSNLRMDYIKLLVFSLQKNQLLGIFADDPPVEIQIPPFPGGVSLATMKDYISTLAAVDRGSGDTNLRTVSRMKNIIPLNIIPEETEILCYMLHGGNEMENSPRKSCGCSSTERSPASEGRQSGRQPAPRPNPLEFPWLREVPGQERYDMGYQDPWLNYHYLHLKKKPKPKKKLFTAEEEQKFSFPSFDVSGNAPVAFSAGGFPEEEWRPAEEVMMEEIWENQMPSDISDQQRVSSPQGRSSGRPRSHSPQRFQQSPQQMRQSPQTPRRSPQTPRLSPQMQPQSPHTPSRFAYSPQGAQGFSPQYISTPTRGSPRQPQDWSNQSDNNFEDQEFPIQYYPGMPKPRWVYSSPENNAIFGNYNYVPPLSQSLPTARMQRRQQQRDPAMETMHEYGNRAMQDSNYYPMGPAHLYEPAYDILYRGDISSAENPPLSYEGDENAVPPQLAPAPSPRHQPLPASTSFTTPRRPGRISPPRQLNATWPAGILPSSGGSPRQQKAPCLQCGNVAPPIPSPDQRFWGAQQRSPSPVANMARRSPSPSSPRDWGQQQQQQLNYADYTGTVDPRSFASSYRSEVNQSLPVDTIQRRRRPLYVHHCNCSCGSSAGQQPQPQLQQQPPNLDTSAGTPSLRNDQIPGSGTPRSFNMAWAEQSSNVQENSNPAIKQDSDDTGKTRMPQLDASSPDSAHSVWEEGENSGNSVPPEVSAGELSMQQKSNCRCSAKGERYQNR